MDINYEKSSWLLRIGWKINWLLRIGQKLTGYWELGTLI